MISRNKFTLGKEERLKSRKAIEELFRNGKSFALFPFRVYYMQPGQDMHSGKDMKSGQDMKPGQDMKSRQAPVENVPSSVIVRRIAVRPPLQTGFGASSRNFKKAVDRNRIKRLTREAYRLSKKPLQERLEEKGRSLILFIIYTGKEIPEYHLVAQKMGLLLQKLVREAGL